MILFRSKTEPGCVLAWLTFPIRQSAHSSVKQDWEISKSLIKLIISNSRCVSNQILTVSQIMLVQMLFLLVLCTVSPKHPLGCLMTIPD